MPHRHGGVFLLDHDMKKGGTTLYTPKGDACLLESQYARLKGPGQESMKTIVTALLCFLWLTTLAQPLTNFYYDQRELEKWKRPCGASPFRKVRRHLARPRKYKRPREGPFVFARSKGLEPSTSRVHDIQYFRKGVDYIFTMSQKKFLCL